MPERFFGVLLFYGTIAWSINLPIGDSPFERRMITRLNAELALSARAVPLARLEENAQLLFRIPRLSEHLLGEPVFIGGENGGTDDLSKKLTKQLKTDQSLANGTSIAFLAEFEGKSVFRISWEGSDAIMA